MLVIVFSGCNLNPLNKDQFDLRDTVTVSVGEKLYENKNLWVRLDSITRDNRCPEGMHCIIEGGVEAKFTIGFVDTSITLYLSTDSVLARMAFFAFTQAPGGRNLLLYMISARPERYAGIDIPQRNYRIDFLLEEGDMVYKPNIYLYPKITTKMDVSLEFPQGGHVTVSDPNYPDEWQNIKVTPGSKIDGEHDFLFYEAALPDHWQYEKGWAVKQAGLKTFFEDNLKTYGFNMREIADFTDYWIPRLKESPYYAIYPQHTAKIDEIVELNISKNPKSILRLFYVIKDIPEFEDMPVPMIPDFERKGFTVTEWGVVLK
jgi:hypothetical protein